MFFLIKISSSNLTFRLEAIGFMFVFVSFQRLQRLFLGYFTLLATTSNGVTVFQMFICNCKISCKFCKYRTDISKMCIVKWFPCSLKQNYLARAGMTLYKAYKLFFYCETAIIWEIPKYGLWVLLIVCCNLKLITPKGWIKLLPYIIFIKYCPRICLNKR